MKKKIEVKLLSSTNSSAKGATIATIDNFMNQLMELMPREIRVDVDVFIKHPEIVSIERLNTKRFQGKRNYTQTDC